MSVTEFVSSLSCVLANMRARISHAVIENHLLLFYNQTVFCALLPFILTFEHILSHIRRHAFRMREISMNCIACELWWSTIRNQLIWRRSIGIVCVTNTMKSIRSMRMIQHAFVRLLLNIYWLSIRCRLLPCTKNGKEFEKSENNISAAMYNCTCSVELVILYRSSYAIPIE